MRKFFLRLCSASRYDLRASIARNTPYASGLMSVVVSISLAEHAWSTAIYFGAFLLGFIALHWIAVERTRWDRVMGWLPDALRGKE